MSGQDNPSIGPAEEHVIVLPASVEFWIGEPTEHVDVTDNMMTITRIDPCGCPVGSESNAELGE